MGKIRSMDGDEVMKELRELSAVLSSMPRTNPFAVPDGYFDQLYNSLVFRTQRHPELASGSEVLKEGQTDISVFKVPLGYFDELPGRIIEQLGGDDPELSDRLEELRKVNPYRVPDSYFQQLTPRLAEKPRREQPAKVRPMAFQFRIVAVAASLVGAILILLPLMNRDITAVATEPTREDVSDYMLANLEDFSDAEVIQFIGDEALSEIASDEAMLNEIELKNYLIDEVDYYQLQDEWL